MGNFASEMGSGVGLQQHMEAATRGESVAGEQEGLALGLKTQLQADVDQSKFAIESLQTSVLTEKDKIVEEVRAELGLGTVPFGAAVPMGGPVGLN